MRNDTLESQQKRGKGDPKIKFNKTLKNCRKGGSKLETCKRTKVFLAPKSIALVELE